MATATSDDWRLVKPRALGEDMTTTNRLDRDEACEGSRAPGRKDSYTPYEGRCELINVLHFHVLHFHVLHFHVLLLLAMPYPWNPPPNTA